MVESDAIVSWEWLGIVAGVLTTLSFVPQVMKVWKSRSADDLSLGMFTAFTVGIVCWLGYGIAKNDLPVIIANSLTFALSSAILCMKLIFDRRARILQNQFIGHPDVGRSNGNKDKP